MTDIQRKVARTLSEYVQVVEDLSSCCSGLWFRGQSSAYYQLLPGSLRSATRITDGYGNKIVRGLTYHSTAGDVTSISTERMLDEFKCRARPFVVANVNNDFEWMFLAQHHGLPTRLLDWSTNALVALYFAASSAKIEKGNGDDACEEFLDPKRSDGRDDGFAVFSINPCLINKETIDVNEPVDASGDYETWKHYIDPTASSSAMLPICVVAPHISSRIRSQSGNFTLHGSYIQPLERLSLLIPLITKIFIPNTSTQTMITSLDRIGVNRSFIYPSLDSVAFDIAETERKRHKKWLEDYFSVP